MIAICRCCNAEIPAGHRYTDVVISRERSGNKHVTSGQLGAVACLDCADAVAAGVLHVARLWVPDSSCAHHTAELFDGLR